MLNEVGRTRPELFRVTVRLMGQEGEGLQLLVLGRHALKELRDKLFIAARDGRATGLRGVTISGLFGEVEEPVHTHLTVDSAIRAIELFRASDIQIESPAIEPAVGSSHHE